MENQTPKKNSNVIYFLIVVILALIGTDIYLFLKKKQTDKMHFKKIIFAVHIIRCNHLLSRQVQTRNSAIFIRIARAWTCTVVSGSATGARAAGSFCAAVGVGGRRGGEYQRRYA